MSEIRLDIGCGSEATKREGFIGVDKFTDAADVKADMWDLPYEDGTVDEIWAAQSLEHIGKHQVVPTLKEWKRVLKVGGRLEIRVPDLEWSCIWWLRHQTTAWDMDIIYGHQGHEGEFHKTGFTPKILWDYFTQILGFKIESIIYDAGQSQLYYDDTGDGGIREKVDQRIVVLVATRIEEETLLK